MLTILLALTIEKCHRRLAVTEPPRTEPVPVETLWTAVVVTAAVTAAAAVAVLLTRRITETTREQREELARQAARDAQASLAMQLKPYETEVTRETLLQTIG